MEPLIDPYSRNLLICFELSFSPNRTSLFQQRTRLHGISGSFVSGGKQARFISQDLTPVNFL